MDCTDNYTHSSPNVMYFPNSIPTEEVEDMIEPTAVFCNCIGVCSIETNCFCLSKSGSFYKYDHLDNLANYELLDRPNLNTPAYECNNQCKCKDALCGHKLVQCGPRDNLTIRQCDDVNKGEGLYTENIIKPGNFVCEYAGEIISEKEASIRFKLNAKARKMNYIFCINEHFGENNVKTFIDPTHYGNIGRYINHSCEPNCKMVAVRINYNIPVLALFACRYINKGEEITYDYGISDVDVVSDLEVTGNERTKCLCKSETCRMFLPYDTRIG